MQQGSEKSEGNLRGHGNLVPYKSGADWKGNRNGRPKGSRHKLSEDFIADLYQAWLAHGPDIIRYSIVRNPVAVMQAVATLVPKDYQLTVDAGPSFRGLWEAIAKGKLPPPPSEDE